MQQLTIEQVRSLLGESKPVYKPKDLLHLSKHVHWSDKSGTCAARGCRAPTSFKLKGIWYCIIHLIRGLVIELEKYDPTADAEGNDLMLSTHTIGTGKYEH